MKIFVASDIHGSEDYCKLLAQRIDAEQPDRVVLLGDLLYHGPRNDLPDGYNPKGVIALLNSMAERLLCVRGNCDGEVDQMVLNFPITADCCMLFIGGRRVLATHGHIYSNDNAPALTNGDIVLSGHTHMAGHRVQNGVLYANPGSVSLPKEETNRGYIILNDVKLCWHKLETGEMYDQCTLDGESI